MISWFGSGIIENNTKTCTMKLEDRVLQGLVEIIFNFLAEIWYRVPRKHLKMNNAPTVFKSAVKNIRGIVQELFPRGP